MNWQTATTFPDLCHLMASWLEGTSNDAPNVCGDLETETTPLLPTLASCNRAGYLTECSQPGETGPTWRQRAGVEGFVADHRLLDEIVSRSRKAGLITIVNGTYKDRVVVTEARKLLRWSAQMWFGARADDENLDYWWEDSTRSARSALRSATYLAIVDPHWGPSDRLWRLLDQAVGRR